jgi:ketosteroid isomerase-like protein
MTEPEKIVARFLKAYQDTAQAKDLEGHLALFSEEVLVFDTWEAWSFQGIEAMRAMVIEWFGSLGTEHPVVEHEGMQASGTSEMVMGAAILKFSAVSAEGKTLRSLQNRFTWVLRSQGGSWRIVHQHASVPISGELKAILQCKAT